ncbi:GntR family transcriptional regulator [Metabacillus sp. GX 13764]|uniref:GntR family transcriptional regulator YhfZ n=1 Tax=Metabacillus kandeliae TaxID=2900151 RepID=UPI001E3745DD|nr:GntR family transcriptional regulator YhfZ [Metabacillus kandeliae]MCD7034576.1 GntR family transcriptional regulator [Metabacillus kandeliae]
MNILQDLYSKSGMVMRKVAEELLFVEVGERVPKINELAEKYAVGRGTIQSVLKKMEETDCIKLESRGHLGTFLRMKNVPLLLNYGGVSNLVGVMPLPYSKKYEGLATALHEEFSQIDLPLHVAFMRGAQVRVANVLEGRYDFAVVSRFAAEEACEQNKDLLIVKEMGVSTYVTQHALIFSDVKERLEDGMKVGVDSFSTDQHALTLAETEGKKVEMVQLNYMHLLENLKANKIDAMVWNVDEIDKSRFHITSLASEKARHMDKEMSNAVLVVHASNKKIQYLSNLLDSEKILKIQQEVERGERIPSY